MAVFKPGPSRFCTDSSATTIALLFVLSANKLRQQYKEALL